MQQILLIIFTTRVSMPQLFTSWFHTADSFPARCLSVCTPSLGGIKGHLCHTSIIGSSFRMLFSGLMAAVTSYYVSKAVCHIFSAPEGVEQPLRLLMRGD